MAQVTSGTVKSNTLWYSTFYVSWSRTSYSIPNNTSTISWEAGLITSNSVYWLSNAVKINSVVINGTTVLSGQTYSNISGNGTHKLASGTLTINHNTDGNKSFSISISGWLYDTGSPSGSGTFELPTIPRYATSVQSLNSKTETTITMNWSSDSTCDYIWYSTDWGTTWKAVGSVNATSGSYTISTQSKDTSSLSANTTYNIITRVRRKDSQLTTNSSKLSVTTYNYPYVSAVETSALTIGNSQKLTLYNPLSRSVSVYMYQNDTGIQLYSGTTSSTSITFTPTASTLYSSIPSSQTGNCYYYCVYSGQIKAYKYGTYKIKGTETPTLGTITYADTNSTVTAITGDSSKIVQNYSNLKVTFTSATAKNSASISKHTFVLNGVTKTSTSSSGTVDFGTIDSGSNLTLTVTVTDSRGLTAKTTKTITMLAHSSPTAIVTLERLNNYEDETYLTVDGSVSSVNSKNTMTIKYRYKLSGGSYGSYTTIGDKVKQTLSLNKNNVYIFNIVVTDAFGSTYNKEHTLGKGTFPLFIDTEKNSLGMNALPTGENVFEMDGYLLENKREFCIPTNSSTNYGWYLAFSGNMTGYQNRAFMLAIQQSYNGTSGILYMNLRCNNSVSLVRQQFTWVSASRISSDNVKLVLDGNNFYLYLKTTANYQQYYIKILQEKYLNGINYGLFTINTPTVTDTVDGVDDLEGYNPSYQLDNYLPLSGGKLTGNAYVEKSSNESYFNAKRTDTGTEVWMGVGAGGVNHGVYSTTMGKWLIYGDGDYVYVNNYKTLYNNSSGTTGTVTLSDDASNYNFIEIYFKDNNSKDYNYVKVSAPSGKVVSLNCFEPSDTPGLYIRTSRYTISGTSMTRDLSTYSVLYSSSQSVTTNNYLYVVKVLGYK